MDADSFQNAGRIADKGVIHNFDSSASLEKTQCEMCANPMENKKGSAPLTEGAEP